MDISICTYIPPGSRHYLMHILVMEAPSHTAASSTKHTTLATTTRTWAWGDTPDYRNMLELKIPKPRKSFSLVIKGGLGELSVLSNWTVAWLARG